MKEAHVEAVEEFEEEEIFERGVDDAVKHAVPVDHRGIACFLRRSAGLKPSQIVSRTRSISTSVRGET